MITPEMMRDIVREGIKLEVFPVFLAGVEGHPGRWVIKAIMTTDGPVSKTDPRRAKVWGLLFAIEIERDLNEIVRLGVGAINRARESDLRAASREKDVVIV